jgi:hypothetical protein
LSLFSFILFYFIFIFLGWLSLWITVFIFRFW